MTKLIKVLAVATVLVSVLFFTSCEKNEVNIQNSEENLKPIENFSVKFIAASGNFSTNDNNFIENNDRIRNALSNLNINIRNNKSLGDVEFTISDDGKIISKSEDYDGRFFVEVLMNEGGLTYYNQDFSVTFDSNGFNNISNTNLFSIYPNLEQDLIDAGESYKEEIATGEILTLTFKGSKFYRNGEEIPLFSYQKDPTWQEFRDCVGWYWWSPGLNVVFCGVGELIFG